MSVVASSKEYVEKLFGDANTEQLSYHNLEHTLNVLEAVELIAGNTPSVSEKEKECLQLAALFHDVAYLNSPENHEAESAQIAVQFLQAEKYPNEACDLVKKLVLSTKLEHKPSNSLEQIMSDADLSHLGRSDYMETTFRSLAQEMKQLSEGDWNKKEWAKKCLSFLTQHQYQTEFAQQAFGPQKQKNVEKIKMLIQEQAQSAKPKKTKKRKKKSAETPVKGVETMFRVALRNHLSLSQIADNKANTLISVNAIIISIVLSALFPKLDSNPYLFYPGVSILLFTIITIILSILSTIPNVNRGLITRNEVMEKKGNLLFFGNFFKMELEDYEWGMNELINDKEYIYNTLSRDLYFLGKVLNKKYKLLRYAYYSFVFGLIASIIIFVVSISSIIHAW